MALSDAALRLPFRPKARLLQLIGDQLIGSPRLAVFELVKNAYDADARKVVVTIEGLDTDSPSISIGDDGEGMSLETIRDIWLVPAHDHREKQRRQLRRSKLNRLPLGEKGLGRFAVHKLGDVIELVTRAAGQPECVVKIDWRKLIAKPFLADANVTVSTRKPEIFTGRHTGTHDRPLPAFYLSCAARVSSGFSASCVESHSDLVLRSIFRSSRSAKQLIPCPASRITATKMAAIKSPTGPLSMGHLRPITQRAWLLPAFPSPAAFALAPASSAPLCGHATRPSSS